MNTNGHESAVLKTMASCEDFPGVQMVPVRSGWIRRNAFGMFNVSPARGTLRARDRSQSGWLRFRRAAPSQCHLPTSLQSGKIFRTRFKAGFSFLCPTFPCQSLSETGRATDSGRGMSGRGMGCGFAKKNIWISHKEAQKAQSD